MESTKCLPCGMRRFEAETRHSPFQSGLFHLIITLGALAVWTPTAAAPPRIIDPALFLAVEVSPRVNEKTYKLQEQRRAIFLSHLALMERLITKGTMLHRVQVTDMVPHQAAAAGDLELAVYLLEQGEDVDVRSGIDESTPLHVAAHSGHIEIVRLLIAGGADIRARAAGGTTPMHMAALGGHAEIVELLLSHGTDVNISLNSNDTPLNIAAREGHVDIVELLLQRGAEIDSRGHDTRTPLMEAAENGHVDVVAVLLRNGADLMPRSAENSGTALALAQAAGRVSVADLLRRYGATD